MVHGSGNRNPRRENIPISGTAFPNKIYNLLSSEAGSFILCDQLETNTEIPVCHIAIAAFCVVLLPWRNDVAATVLQNAR